MINQFLSANSCSARLSRRGHNEQITSFLNCRSAVRSCPWSPVQIKHTAKAISAPHKLTIPLNSRKFTLIPAVQSGKRPGKHSRQFDSFHEIHKINSESAGGHMARGVIYKITVKNWDKYNGTKKKGHKCILLSCGFLGDGKIRLLSPVTKLLYLSCLLVAGESNASHIEVNHESLVYQSGVKSGSIQSQLDLLQSLQLLTYEKIEPLLDRIGKNRRRKERIPVGDLRSAAPTALAPSGKANEVIALYCRLWKAKYNARPVITPKESGIIGRLVKDLGEKRVTELVEGYMRHPGAMFAERRHDIGTFRLRLQDVSHFIDTGAFINRRTLQEAEENQHFSAKYSPQNQSPEQREQLRQVFEPNPTNLLKTGES